MKQIVLATTLFGAMTAAAAVDQSSLGSGYSERILISANNAPVPEVVSALTAAPGAVPVLARFDRVLSLDDVIAPQHPSQWRVEDIDAFAWERLLRSHWGLGDEAITLVVDSVHVPPAATLARIFADARIMVLSEGLMSYGATRDPQAHSFGQRIESLVHLDLVEGLVPLLLSEHGVPPIAVEAGSFRALVEEMAADQRDRLDVLAPPSAAPTALVLGQYLSALGLISVDEELEMQVQMLEVALDRGATRVLFKAHPSAPASDVATLVDAARRLGVEIVVVRDAVPAEVLMAARELAVVVASFSTALATARHVFDLPIAAVGVDRLLEALRPYENSNRIPATIIRALTGPEDQRREGADLQNLVTSVAYCMQPRTFARGRDTAEAFLSTVSVSERAAYFRRRRLGSLGLPGGIRAGRKRQAADRVLAVLPPSTRAAVESAVRKARGR